MERTEPSDGQPVTDPPPGPAGPPAAFRLRLRPGPVLEQASPALAALLGYDPGDIVGAPEVLARLVHPDHRHLLQVAVVGPRVGPVTVRARHRDGSDRWLEVRGAVVDGGGPRDVLDAEVTDVTAWRSVEHELALRTAQVRTLADLTQQVFAGAGLDTLFEHAVALVALDLEVDLVSVFELDRDGRALLLRAGHGFRHGEVGRVRVLTGRESHAGYTLRAGGPVVVDDMPEETRFQAPPHLAAYGVRSGASVPIPGPEGLVFGVLAVHTFRPHRFAPADVDFLRMTALVLLAAIRLAGMRERAAGNATVDRLTGLPDRDYLLGHATRSITRLRHHTSRAALVAFEVDGFDRVHDILGPDSDGVLRLVAARFASLTRDRGVAGRVGDHSFAALLDDVLAEDGALEFAGEVRDLLAEPIEVAGHALSLTASFGVALGPNGASTGEQLLANANLALHRAKEAGPGSVRCYDEDLRARVDARAGVERALRAGIDRGELRLHYQPLVDLAGGHPVGFEALVRWEHPERGLLLPKEFLGIAAESGLLVPIGAWVLGEACRQIAAWRDTDVASPAFVTVNLHSAQLTDDLPDAFAAALHAHDVPASALVAEVTEVAVLDSGRAPDVLRDVRSLGVRLALDDFGTGYSSLSHLRKLPAIDLLKIDRSFVTGIGDGAGDEMIIAAVASLGRGLGIDVAAEGIETAAQARHVRRLGVGIGQGFHWQRPAPAAELGRWLRRPPGH